MIFSNIAMDFIQRFTLEKILLGNFNQYRVSIVRIRTEFWIAVAWYLIVLWCFVTVFTLLLVKLM